MRQILLWGSNKTIKQRMPNISQIESKHFLLRSHSLFIGYVFALWALGVESPPLWGHVFRFVTILPPFFHVINVEGLLFSRPWMCRRWLLPPLFFTSPAAPGTRLLLLSLLLLVIYSLPAVLDAGPLMLIVCWCCADFLRLIIQLHWSQPFDPPFLFSVVS